MEHKEHKKTEHHDKHVEHKKHDKHEVHHEKKVAHHSKTKSKISPWQIATALLAVLFVASVFTNGFSSTESTESLSTDEIESKALDYINTQLLGGQASAEIVSVADKGSFYELDLKVQGQEVKSYVTKDGNMLFPTGLDMNEEIEAPTQAPPPVTEVEAKSDKPVVELFVMSHCPYGTQIEKGMLPVALLLDDKIDFELKFVYYAMHGEVETTEQLNQYCIQKEQDDLFLGYLECFLEAGDTAGCLDSTGIDTDALTECTEAADEEFSVTANLEDQSSYLSGKFPMFNVHKAENDQYAIRGSPSLVINGEQVSAGRDSVSLLSAVCGAFNEAPEECDTEFEAGSPGPGFGWDSSGSANVASCGG